MRHHSASLPPNDASNPQRSDWQTLKSLWPYVWASKGRVLLALSALILAKLMNLAIPTTLKHIVDQMTPNPTAQDPFRTAVSPSAIPLSRPEPSLP